MSLLPLIGWAVLPGYATSFLQSVYYGITIRAGDPKPMPQTPRFELHRRRIFILVIVSYLFYTLYETFHQVQVAGNYYTLLDVTPFDTDKTIQSKFRRLAARYHPDKIGHQDGADILFMLLRQAEETLLDPVQRFAYDRFGPDALKWGGQLKTTQEFFMISLTRLVLPQYVMSLAAMLVLNWLWWGGFGRYWRFFSLAAMVVLELALITRPRAVFMPAAYLPPALSAWLPAQSFHLLPFQVLTIARRVSITIHIFISQMAPKGQAQTTRSDGGVSPQTMQQVVKLVQTAQQTDLEATRSLQLAQAPFRGDCETVSGLRRGMQEALVLAGVRSSPGVQQAVGEVIQRRQGAVDTGADDGSGST
ncbi:unnamed protein product [Penicillium pancosmium]